MASLSSEAFIRFGICSLVMQIYYVFFGLYATYDMADQQNKLKSLKVDDGNIKQNAGP